MSTKTETKPAAEVVVAANAKVTACVITVATAAAGTLSKKRILSDTVRAEADREGYDKSQAAKMVAASWLAAFKMDTATEAERAAFSLKSRPDVSKVVTLAYPAKPAELEKAYAHNDKLGVTAPKHNRIGENTLLEIARGNVTFNQAINAKAASKAKSGLDAVSTPQERFANSIKGILSMHKVGEKGRITGEEAQSIATATIEAYLNPPAKAPAKKAAK